MSGGNCILTKENGRGFPAIFVLMMGRGVCAGKIFGIRSSFGKYDQLPPKYDHLAISAQKNAAQANRAALLHSKQ